MATILSLALKVNADASGVVKNLTPAERALENLAKQAAKSTSAFDALAKGSQAAADAQAALNEKFNTLAQQLQGGLNAQAYADQFAALQEEVRNTADAFAEGARVTEEMRTAEERHAQQLAKLDALLAKNAISEETHTRAVAKADAALLKASTSADKFADETTRAATQGLKFNELSGILAALPGPLGNIAGRFSGISSAAEGLNRVFAGGLKTGLSSLGAQLSALATPLNLGVAAFAAFGAAATSVVGGLLSLEAQTERLQNSAEKLGVSFGFMQTLQQAAEMSGVSFESVDGSMTRLLKTLAGADEESKAATAALGRLGVTLNDLNGKNSETQLKLIGERLQGIEDPAKRAAAATAIFGKSGAELLPFFQNLGTAEQTLTRFNTRLSDLDVGRVLALGDSFDAVKASLAGLSNELLTPFIGVTQSLGDGLASAIATFGRNIGAVLDIFSPLTSAVGAAGNLFLQFGSIISNIVGTVLEPFAAVGRLVSGAIDGISQSITTVAGLVNDAVVGFREFFRFEPLAAQLRDTLSQVPAAFQQVIDIASRVATIIGTALSQLGSAIGSTFGSVIETLDQGVSSFVEFVGIGDTVAAFTASISQAFGSLWESIKAVVGQVGGFIEQVLTFAEDWLGIKRDVEQPVVATVELNDGGAIAELAQESKTLQSTIDSVTKNLSSAIDESAAFGQAGFDAALRYQESIRELQQQLDDGIINEEVFRRSAEQAGNAFKEELAKIEQDAKLEIQVTENAAQAVAGIRAELSKAIDESAALGQAGFDAALEYQNAVEELQRQFEAGIINEETLSRGAEAAQAAYEAQVESVKKLEQEQRKLIENDRERIDTLLAANDDATKLEQDLQAVQREQARVSEELTAARAADNQTQADAAAARQGELDQLQASLEEQQQALEQGFSQGFQAAFDNVNQNIDGLIAKSQQFGQAGFDAALRLQEGIAAAQQQAQDGILNQEAFNAEVQRQQELFNAELQHLEDVKKKKEQDEQDAIARQNQQNADLLKAQDEYRKQQQQAQQAYAEEQKRIFEEQRKAAEAEAKRQEERLRKLNTLGQQSINVADVRSVEGANLVLQTAANAQDPALIQARLQTKLLEQVALGISQAASNYFNQPVAIIGAARMN